MLHPACPPSACVRVQNAVACIDSKANVCSVQFSPTNSNLMAFGSANFRVYLYDLRNIQVRTRLCAWKAACLQVLECRHLNGCQIVSKRSTAVHVTLDNVIPHKSEFFHVLAVSIA